LAVSATLFTAAVGEEAAANGEAIAVERASGVAVQVRGCDIEDAADVGAGNPDLAL